MGLKKTIIVSSLIILLSSAASASPAGHVSIEARGAYIGASFEGFNVYHKELFSYSYGIDAENSVIREMGSGELTACYGAAEGIDVILRLSMSSSYLTDVLHDEFHDKDVITSNVSVNILYAGIGARHVPAVFFGSLRPYIGADAGVFYSVSSSWEVNADSGAYFTPDGYDYQKTDLSGSVFFGAHFEAGIDWRFFEGYGLSVYAGYRAASFDSDFSTQGLFADAHYESPLKTDISGFYAGAGISISFNTEEELPLPDGEEIPSVSTPEKTEAEADAFFAAKDYIKAAGLYADALKQGGGFMLYKKLSACFFRMKDINRAVRWGEMYIKHNPADTQFASWLEKLKQ